MNAVGKVNTSQNKLEVGVWSKTSHEYVVFVA